MTWNIWWRFGPRWQDRQHGLVETLRAVDADVVALQEVWGTAETTQAHDFAGQLGLHAAFAAPSYPPAPEAPSAPDHEGVAIGLGLLRRWPITSLRQVELPARHRRLTPVAMAANLAHPAGPLHVVAACLDMSRPIPTTASPTHMHWSTWPPTLPGMVRCRSLWPATSTPPEQLRPAPVA